MYESIYARCIFVVITAFMSQYYVDKPNDVVNGLHVIFKFVCSGMVFVVFFLFPLCLKAYKEAENRAVPYVLAACFLIWSYYFFCYIQLLFSKWLSLKTSQNENRKQIGRIKETYVWLVIFVGVCLICGLYSINYYPGVISPDNINIFGSAKNIADSSARTDIHSFAYTVINYFVYRFGGSFYALTWMMVIGIACAWATLFTYFYKKGMRGGIILGLTVLWFLIPENIYMSISTWKDEPFVIALLFVMYFLIRYYFEGEDVLKKPLNVVFFIVAMLGVGLFRSNGQIIVFLFAVVSIFFLWKRHARYLALSCVLAGIFLLVIKIPVYQYLHVESTPKGYAAAPFVDGVWENVVHENKLPSDVRDFIESELLPYDEFKKSYEEKYYNIYVLNTERISFDKARDSYIQCLKDYPFTTIMARLKKTYNIWNFFSSNTYMYNNNYVLNLPEGYRYLDKFYRFRVGFALYFSGNSVLGEIFNVISRGGFCIIIWITMFWQARLRHKNILLLLLPAISNMGGLLIACCFNDLRYIYPICICTFFAFITFLVSCISSAENLAEIELEG